ncbi:hypothetical protein M9Y10_003141 [Tritrichomonas musculus]|uniref:DnaK protein n=1 Tax=Tritrichomonas musculus TaxID=1915356 RepID=A0ABR2JP54_9EUKA
MKKIPFGIDFATTYSAIAVNNVHGGPRVLKDNSSKSARRTMCSFEKNGRIIFGSAAESVQLGNLESTIYDTKIMLGQPFSSPIIENKQKTWLFKIEKAPDSDQLLINIPSQNKKLRPVEVIRLFLNDLIESGNKCLPKDKKNRQAVIAVPANFSALQKKEIEDAAKLANIELLGLLNEPTAACIACAYGNDFLYEKPSSDVIIFDFGAGTLDVSLVHIVNQDMKNKLKFDVIAVDGDNHLGGRDFDDIIFNYVVNSLNLDRNNLRLMAMTMQSVVDAKIYLSEQEEADIIIYGVEDYKMKITRKKFEELTQNLIEKSIDPVKRVLEFAHMPIQKVDHIILTGGSSHMPFVKEKLTKFFGKEPFEGVDPQEAVAKGASIVAYNKANGLVGGIEDLVSFKDVASRSIGIATDDGNMSFHVHKNEPLPIERCIVYHNHDYDEGLSIYIFEGENKRCELNDYLGRFELHGIPKRPEGEEQIKVIFRMDDNGLVHVEAQLINSQIHASINVVRYIGDYPEKLKLEKNIAINNINRVCRCQEDPVKKIYRMALAYLNDPENRMKLFLGIDKFQECQKEFNQGIQNSSVTTDSTQNAKGRILSLLNQHFVIHQNIPSFLQN